MKEAAQEKRKPLCAAETAACVLHLGKRDTVTAWFQFKFTLYGNQRDEGLEKGQSSNWAPI